jgi:hypothetical protein
VFERCAHPCSFFLAENLIVVRELRDDRLGTPNDVLENPSDRLRRRVDPNSWRLRCARALGSAALEPDACSRTYTPATSRSRTRRLASRRHGGPMRDVARQLGAITRGNSHNLVQESATVRAPGTMHWSRKHWRFAFRRGFHGYIITCRIAPRLWPAPA